MSFIRHAAFAVVATVTVAATAPAYAEDYPQFDRAAFNAAQAKGLPILLDVHA